jgi:hypothetical protein
MTIIIKIIVAFGYHFPAKCSRHFLPPAGQQSNAVELEPPTTTPLAILLFKKEILHAVQAF